ncbi:MAG: hypothetical protein IPN86_10705 [Saprospiraceae bacterium]|nr:hypothetical protein [Saprospiraceae bacterium]
MKRFFLYILLPLLTVISTVNAQVSGSYPISDKPGDKTQPATLSTPTSNVAAFNAANCDDLSLRIDVRIGSASPAPGSIERVGTQSGRIFRDGVASVCPSKAYPGIFNAATTYGYSALQFTNCGSTPVCITINFDPNTGLTPCGTNGHAAVYQSADGMNAAPYNPANQGANYLGDVGSSLTQPYSVTVNPGFFEVVFANNASVAQCDLAFSFTVPAPDIASIKCACPVAPPQGACGLLVCSGDQNITLPAGACTFTIPNLVTSTGDCDIVQTAGPLTGSNIGPGTYTLEYELVDASGAVIDDCEFDITILPYPNPTSSLVANDQVNVSLDDDGWSLVTTDMILEGGPYGCYDGYLMRRNPVVSGTPPTQALTIPLATNPAYPGYTYGAVWVNCSDIGKRIEVEVLDPVTGNRAWGYVNVEDKIAPVVTCSCQDITTLSPLAPFTGAIANTDPTFVRPTGTAACAAGTNVSFYDTHTFAVSVTGNYTFNAANSAGDTYAILYQAPFNPADPCANFIIANDDTAGGLDPLFTTALTAGVQYVYVMTTFGANSATGAYTVAVTGPGQFLTNPSNAPECQFACYDIEIVKRETVGMLYNIPGLNANKSKLTTPPTYTDNCGVTSVTFEDRVTSTNCGASKLIRDWKYVDGFGNIAICSQTFTFNQISVFDLAVPTREVHLSCGLDASPAAIAGYTDIDSRPQPASAANIGAFADDYAATPTVVELNEGYANGYFTYLQRGFDGNMHPQKWTMEYVISILHTPTK